MNKRSKRVLSFILAIVMAFGLLPITALAAEEAVEPMANFPFHDVSISDWFFPAVRFVNANGVMSGTTPTTFAPNENFSRAQVVATLFRIHHGRAANASDSRTTPFQDVPTGQWFAPYVSWAYHNGIVEGITEYHFAPLANVDRQQFATMLFRFADRMTNRDTTVRQGPQWNSFTDRGEIQSWAVNALTWANYHGFVQGRTPTTIAPRGTATRAEAATMLTRFMGGNADPLPPQRVNIANMMGVRFDTVRHQFGHFTGTGNHELWRTYRFASGIFVGVNSSGMIASIQVDYTNRGGNIVFHYNGIDHTSTRHNIRTLLGEPTVSDGISYAYWLSGQILTGPVLNFIFDSQANDRVSVIMFSHVG